MPALARSLPSFLGRGLAVLLALAGGCVAPARASEPSAIAPDATELELWPGVAPGSQQLASLRESITERSSDPLVRDRFVAGVVRPRLLVFRASRPNGTGLIIAPGGAYVRTVLDKEGLETARWMAARGVSAFVLLYRLPGEGHAQRADVPLQDAQRAVRLVRGHARDLALDERRIGVLGFSAGGHVAASVATRFGARVYAPVDALDAGSARPDFAILLYPVISMAAGFGHAGSRQALLGAAPGAAAIASYSLENAVTSATPPTLLIATGDDAAVLPENSLRYYSALQQHGVPGELHIFARGGHGFGIRLAQGLPVGSWPELARTWLAGSGLWPAGN